MNRSPLLPSVVITLLAACAGPESQLETATPAPRHPHDEVSVGYGIQLKRNTMGAVSSFYPTETDAHVGRVEEMLIGRVAGLEVLRQGAGYTLRIRGPSSFRTGAPEDEPLLVIDDVPMGAGSIGASLAGLAPRDIARIDVLKDASSAAVYGARGANGVIIITTKRGR